MLNREQRNKYTRQHISENDTTGRFIRYKPRVIGPGIFRPFVVSFRTCGKEQMAYQRRSWREARKLPRNKARKIRLEACGYYCV